MPNIRVVEMVCELLDEVAAPLAGGRKRCDLIEFVEDRPGHDLRYAVGASKIERELGWTPRETFASGLRRTVEWYIQNEKWWRPLQNIATRRRGLVPALR